MLYFEDIRVGDSVVSGSYEFSEDEMIAFAKKWDPLPFHIDPVAAAHTPMKGLIASSCQTFSVYALLLNSRMDEPIAGIASMKHEIDLPAPVRPGDILSLKVTYLEKRPSESKPDRGLVTIEGVLNNQTGSIVLRAKSLTLVRRRPM